MYLDLIIVSFLASVSCLPFGRDWSNLGIKSTGWCLFIYLIILIQFINLSILILFINLQIKKYPIATFAVTKCLYIL